MILAMLQWIHSWWIADRIRFTPGHCRLFELAVGDRVLVRNRLWVVEERSEAIAENQVNVHFQLTELEEANEQVASVVLARLKVELQDLNSRLPNVSWSGEDWAEELFEEDVVVLSKRSTRTCSEEIMKRSLSD